MVRLASTRCEVGCIKGHSHDGERKMNILFDVASRRLDSAAEYLL